MLKRKDKKSIPLWVIPNGSGNAYAWNFGVLTVQDSIDALKKGHVLKSDIVKVLIDHDSEEELTDESKLQYAVYGVDLGLSPTLIHKASRKLKNLLGGNAYMLIFPYLMYKGCKVRFDVDLDDGMKTFKGVDLQGLEVANCKYAIRNMIPNPVGFINDGLLEAKVLPAEGMKDFKAKMEALENGFSIYQIENYYRVKSFKAVADPSYVDPVLVRNGINIDGELH